MNFFNQGDLRLKGMLTEVNESHLKFGQVLAMVGVMSIQAAKGASMVFSQCLVSYYRCSCEFDHGEVLICIHGIQMRTDHWDLRLVLSRMALLFVDGAR